MNTKARLLALGNTIIRLNRNARGRISISNAGEFSNAFSQNVLQRRAAKPLSREASLVKEFCDRARLPKAHTSPLDVIRFLELLPQSQDALLCSFQSLVKDS